MASSFGVTNAGFVTKPLTAIVSDLQAGVLSSTVFGNTFDVSSDGPMGQLLGVLAQPIADIWQLAAAVYASFDPDQASGQALVGLCALTGVNPLGALPSTGVEVLVGTNLTSVSAGTILADSTTGAQFTVDNPVVIVTLTAWAAGAFGQGALVTAVGNVYYCTVGGTSASPGPSGTGTFTESGGVVWYCCGAGAAAVSMTITSINAGAFPSAQGNLTVIVTPVVGLSLVANPNVIVLGQLGETDSALRIRRNEELSDSGSATVNAILADLLLLSGVTNAAVFDNPTDTTNGAGLPPHSIQAVVLGGNNQAILNQILSLVGGGGRQHLRQHDRHGGGLAGLLAQLGVHPADLGACLCPGRRHHQLELPIERRAPNQEHHRRVRRRPRGQRRGRGLLPAALDGKQRGRLDALRAHLAGPWCRRHHHCLRRYRERGSGLGRVGDDQHHADRLARRLSDLQ